MAALSDAAKTFDTSGKSGAPVHHRAISKTSMALRGKVGKFPALIPNNISPTMSSSRIASAADPGFDSKERSQDRVLRGLGQSRLSADAQSELPLTARQGPGL